MQYCLRNHLLINKAAAVTRSEKQSGSLVASASQCSSSVAKGYNEKEKASARNRMPTSSSGEATRVAVASSAKHLAEDALSIYEEIPLSKQTKVSEHLKAVQAKQQAQQ